MERSPDLTIDKYSRRPTALVVALHVITFAALIAWSWRKWPDPIVDFGRELYVPWQITEGKVPFRDLASLFGPFSPYLNALWFRLFGTSLMTLALCNLVILAAATAGIYRLIHRSTDRLTATAATLSAVLLCGFSQYLDVGNYNFITPYSHEATHGVALSIAALVALDTAFASRRAWIAGLSGLSGLFFGLVLLTKPEISLALCFGVVIGFAAVWSIARDDRTVGHSALAFVAGTLVAPCAFLLYFHLGAGMPLQAATRAVAGGWTAAFETRIANNVFYAKLTGLDHPIRHAVEMVLTFVTCVLLIAAATALVRWTPATRVGRAASAIVRAFLLLAVAFAIPRFQLSRALPMIVAIGLAAAVIAGRSQFADVNRAERQLPLIMWSAFALGLLAKMFLDAQIYHYGFYLALPAVTIAVVVLLWFVPMLVAAMFGDAVARRARSVFVAVVAVAIAPHLALSQTWFSTKHLAVGSAEDMFLAGSAPLFWQGEAVNEALQWIEARTSSDATISVVPEGVMINYLSRRRTPLRFINFMPPELIAFGEASIVRAFDDHPPDFVLLVNRNTAEYGFSSFGSSVEYGRATMAWIGAHYERMAVIGRDPTSASGEGIVVLKRIRS